MARSSFILSLVGCLISVGSALADDSHIDHNPGHDHNRDDIHFECEFHGIHLRRVPLFCEVHGRIDSKIPRDRYITGDHDDRLTVTCDDHLIYDDGIVYGLFSDRDRRGTFDDGHGDRNRDERDRFFDVKLLSLTPFTAAISVENACIGGFDSGSDRSSLTVTLWDHIPLSLLGSCHFRRERHDGRDNGHESPPPLH